MATTSAIRIDHFEKKILISKSFQKSAMNPNSKEYKELMKVQRNHPDYEIAQRAIKKSANKQAYKKLTYEYMRDYIILTSTPEEEQAAVAEFDHLIHVSRCQCQANRYPVIKRWFLNKYPEVKEFGVVDLADVA